MVQRLVEIGPVHIRRIDKIQLPLPRIALHRLFALNGGFDGLMLFVPDEKFAAMLFREAFSNSLAMFKNASRQVGCDADI